ncbi:MAG: LTA synthase family protein [Lentisphaerae bacterium]|nr:LTA synthase family protein [Lentisphaerota bacterium]
MYPVNSGTSPTLTPTAGTRFLEQVTQDLRLWLYCMSLLSLSRVGLIVIFRRLIHEQTGWGSVAAAVLNGIRYDSAIAAWVAAVPLVLSIACLFHDHTRRAAQLRRLAGGVFAFLTALLFMVTTRYFREYNDLFNHFLFGLYYDDTRAILKTIWADYRPLSGLLFVGVSGGAATLLLVALTRSPWSLPPAFTRGLAGSVPRRVGAVLLVLALFVGAARGSFGRRPVQKKDAAVTRDELLNKMVINPYTALRYAFKDHRELSRDKGLRVFLKDEDVGRALRLVCGTDARLATVDEYMRRTAGAAAGPAPDHVFLIIMESYEAWPLFPEFQCLGIARELQGLADRGIAVRPFVPSSSGTMESFAAIVTGLPDAGVHTNYQPTARQPYPSSVAETFRRMGYRTRVFYGGYLSWQAFGDFCRSQGFDEVYGGGQMGPWLAGNEWGVDDEVLFDFTAKTVADSPRSFNVILTTSFHPPYDIDVRGKGFTLARLPESLADKAVDSPDFDMLGHFWYADRCLGEFVRTVEARLAGTLFAVTGDHTGRRSITRQPSVAERSLVPFVLYGPAVLAQVTPPETMAGSHVDIAPTLIELCAPEGTPYVALGRNMLKNGVPAMGIGRDYVVDGSVIWSANAATPAAEAVPWLTEPMVPPGRAPLTPVHRAFHGIAWWRIKRGADLP